MGSTKQCLNWARRVLRTEALSPNEIVDALNGGFVRAAGALLHCKDHVVITGVGRSRHVGQKIAATMASTGTPAFFIHPAEAAHGDLGVIVDNDVVVAISNSGGSDEVTAIIPALKRKDITLVGITACPASTLACHADVHTTAAVSKEACPLRLVLTTSTTAVMALGNMLAVVLLRARAFTPDDFALSHPAGGLDKRLLLRVADTAHNGDALPTVVSDTLLKGAIARMSEKELGMLTVADEADRLKGVLANGDLRRLFQQHDNFTGLTVDDIIHTPPKTITADELTTEALEHMQVGHISGLLVTETDDTLTGALNMHGLLMARVV